MNKTPILMLAAVAVTLVLTGCSDPKKDQRMIMLEDQNRALEAQALAAAEDTDAARREAGDLAARLRAAQDEAQRLREQLASVPASQPAPEPTAAGWTAVPGGAMIAVEGEILFQPGRIAIRPEARSALDNITRTLQTEYADKDIFVLGHTDNQPIKKSGYTDNLQLSTERALAVGRYLIERSIAAPRVVAGGCGEFRPRASNKSEGGRSANRRVEIFAIDTSISPGRTP